MINFKTNGEKECTTVICSVNFGTKPSDRCLFAFKWETNNPHYAYLLTKYLQERYENLIHEAHQKAYEIGYKDGKSKQKKKQRFDNYLGNDNPAY